MNNKSLGWYLGAAVACILAFSIATCISAVIIKLMLTFLAWIF